MMRLIVFFLGALLSFGLIACKNDNSTDQSTSGKKKKLTLKDTVGHTDLVDVTFQADGITFKSFYSKPLIHDKPKPLVLIIPEWWGINDYIRYRAQKIADMGYIGMGVDLYGDGFNTESPKIASEKATYFHTHGKDAYKRFMAALRYAKTIPGVDTNKIAVMGYCFGGGIAGQLAFAGIPVKGVIIFHGDLPQEVPDTNLLKAPMLVLLGDDDKFVSTKDRETFKHNMDKMGGYFKYISYPGAKHAFTNPKSTEVGKKYKLDLAYNEMADESSWRSLEGFLYLIF